MTTLSMKWSRGIRRKYTEEHYAVNRGRWVGSCRWASRAARAAPRSAWPLFYPPGFDRLGRRASLTEIRGAVRGNAAAADAFERLASHLAANGVTLNADTLTLGVAPAFDPVREHFVDSPGADALLAREYRRGFEVREIT